MLKSLINNRTTLVRYFATLNSSNSILGWHRKSDKNGMDATVQGFPLSEKTLRDALSEICAISLDDDITLTLDGIDPIRDDDEYGGFRAALNARYETIRTPLKIDITTGDVITSGSAAYISLQL